MHSTCLFVHLPWRKRRQWCKVSDYLISIKCKYSSQNWDTLDDSRDDYIYDNFLSGENVAKSMRAVIEPMIACNFGEHILDDLFSRHAKNVARHLLKEKTKYPVFIIVLKAKMWRWIWIYNNLIHWYNHLSWWKIYKNIGCILNGCNGVMVCGKLNHYEHKMKTCSLLSLLLSFGFNIACIAVVLASYINPLVPRGKENL